LDKFDELSKIECALLVFVEINEDLFQGEIVMLDNFPEISDNLSAFIIDI